MSDIAIRVNSLSKKYRIGPRFQKHKTLRETIGKYFSSTFSRTDGKGRRNETLWALKDLSFEIKRGQVVGIIGRNGAGKSTLMKILSKITEPTSGYADIYGRVGSLLEVGTGFHWELTGRENIYLSGAIMGMRKNEIARKFDEIVAFAEMEKFIDTPVKHYSSGMYMRLAFAVAAHLEPEILLVDEVLAVGDADFQKKCLGKMEAVGKTGRTVLFISHNMSAVISLCNRAMLLHDGELISSGSTEEIISKYLNYGTSKSGIAVDTSKPGKNQKLKIRKIQIMKSSGKPSGDFTLSDAITLKIDFDILSPGKGYYVGFELHNTVYGCVFCSTVSDTDPELHLQKNWEIGSYQAVIQLPVNILRSGDYWIKAVAAIPMKEMLDVFQEQLSFSLLDDCSPVSKTGEGRLGSVLPILAWNVTRNGSGSL